MLLCLAAWCAFSIPYVVRFRRGQDASSPEAMIERRALRAALAHHRTKQWWTRWCCRYCGTRALRLVEIDPWSQIAEPAPKRRFACCGRSGYAQASAVSPSGAPRNVEDLVSSVRAQLPCCRRKRLFSVICPGTGAGPEPAGPIDVAAELARELDGTRVCVFDENVLCVGGCVSALCACLEYAPCAIATLLGCAPYVPIAVATAVAGLACSKVCAPDFNCIERGARRSTACRGCQHQLDSVEWQRQRRLGSRRAHAPLLGGRRPALLPAVQRPRAGPVC